MSPFEQQIAHYVKTAIYIFAAFLLALLFLIAGGMTARSHEATNTAGQPLGWKWDPWCCGGSDCAIIPSNAVSEGPDGYHVRLKAGQHPMLHTKDYSAIIPYGTEKVSPSGDYGICLGHEGNVRFCFYAGGKGY